MTKTDNSVVWINVIDDAGMKIWLGTPSRTRKAEITLFMQDLDTSL